MSVATVTNRLLLASFRSTLNTWRSAINTLITDVDAVEADVATLQTDVTTLDADKQDASTLSTLNYGVRATNTDFTLLNTDINYIIIVTNAAPSIATLPPTASISPFKAGCPFWVSNSPASTDDVTLTPGASVTITGASMIISPGESALVVMTAANTYRRLTP
jgi:outer membrane murein-binding lipoprotein Lpp